MSLHSTNYGSTPFAILARITDRMFVNLPAPLRDSLQVVIAMAIGGMIGNSLNIVM